jgi:hypothetical protein
MVKINLLTYLTFELNSLIDRGYNMPLKEVKEQCMEVTIIEHLKERFPFKAGKGLDLSLLQPKVIKELNKAFQDLALAGDEREHYGVQKKGLLCFLIAYTQEMIQGEARAKGA